MSSISVAHPTLYSAWPSKNQVNFPKSNPKPASNTDNSDDTGVDSRQLSLQNAQIRQEEANQSRKDAHRKLNTVVTPFCVALGFMIYKLGMLMDPSVKVMKRFKQLLTDNQQLRQAVSQANISLVRDQGQVPPQLRLPLAQLDALLHANDVRPSMMVPYLEEVRQATNGGNLKLSQLGRKVADYHELLQAIMHDKPGFKMLASEMRVRRFMDTSKKQAMDMAKSDREEFFVRLFGRGLNKDEHLDRYRHMFDQLGESHRLRVRLLAFVIPGSLFGYFFSKVGHADAEADES